MGAISNDIRPFDWALRVAVLRCLILVSSLLVLDTADVAGRCVCVFVCSCVRVFVCK